MNTKTLKALTATVSLLAGMTASYSAMATDTGLQRLDNLGGFSPAIDVFTFVCPVGSGARANVNDLAFPNPAGVNVQVVLGRDGAPILQATDATDDGVPSASTGIIPESGLYAVAFKKTGAAVEIYRGQVECCTAAGVCGNPVLTRRINQ